MSFLGGDHPTDELRTDDRWKTPGPPTQLVVLAMLSVGAVLLAPMLLVQPGWASPQWVLVAYGIGVVLSSLAAMTEYRALVFGSSAAATIMAIAAFTLAAVAAVACAIVVMQSDGGVSEQQATRIFFATLAAGAMLYSGVEHWRWRGFVQRYRIAAFVCPVCGYDLRGTRDRCPECGFRRLNLPASADRKPR